MHPFVTAVLVLVGLLHLLPLAGVAAQDPQTELLLRHRAVLFGLLGGFMLWAGPASVASFLWLARRARPLVVQALP